MENHLSNLNERGFKFMSGTSKLALKNELYAQLEEVTEQMLRNPNLTERQLLDKRRQGLQKLIDICKDRNRF